MVVALLGGTGEDFDLAVVEAETSVDRRNLRLDRSLIRQEQPRRAALFDHRQLEIADHDIGQRLGGEDHGRVLLAQRLQPFSIAAKP